MVAPLHVAFIWHQHQPLYKARSTNPEFGGQYRLPWVRLHGTKDYLDLVLLLSQYPKLHQTVNLVPSLILQLEDYAEGLAMDPYLALSLGDEHQLNDKQRRYIIEHFFDGNHHTLVDPHPRYGELFHQRREQGYQWCLEHWQAEDYGDLLAWHNLAWIDPLFWDDPEIARWLAQGRGFTLSDRQRIYRKQRELIRRIIPQHRAMQEAGQLEVTTTPYTHPILPLLADTHAGRVAVPEMALPKNRFLWSEDIPRHLRKAKTLYRERFLRDPRGLWPSEQSVSPAILDDIRAEGFEWICSDEAVLGWSLGHFFHRDALGNVGEPHLLYRPYRLNTSHGDLAIVFRDHRLSDLIGFTYGAMEPQKAAQDLIGHLEAIARMQRHQGEDGEPWLVTIALDGENCWEYYPQDGLPFLRSLYERLSLHPGIALVTVSEFLDRHPPRISLNADRLHSGSWVDGSFTTWIGDPVKNKAWDLLYQARQTLANHPEATEETNPEAWEALYAAEGSDWFWWFGEGHSSNQDAMFDQLFREHLIDLYRTLNEPIPPALLQALEDHGSKGGQHPSSFIHPFIDGIGDDQDWDKAGRLEIGGASGTMHRASAIQRVYYGWDHLNFYLRLDVQRGKAIGQDLPPELHLLWFYPGVSWNISPVPLANVPDRSPVNYLFRHHLGINLISQTAWLEEAGDYGFWTPKAHQARIAREQCLEIAVPWSDLNVCPDYPVRLTLILADDGEYQDTILDEQLIPLQVP